MRFIVDFYRYAILAVFALIIAGFAFLMLSLGNNPDLTQEEMVTAIMVGVGLIGFFGVSLGLIATFISIHDRHIELVEEVRMMREILQKEATN